MDTTLAEAIARLPIRPGQPYRAHVNGQEIEVRIVSNEFASEVPTGDIWLEIPPSPAAHTLTVSRGPRQIPAPIHIADTDLSPA